MSIDDIFYKVLLGSRDDISKFDDDAVEEAKTQLRELVMGKIPSRMDIQAGLLAHHKWFEDYKEEKISFGKLRELIASDVHTETTKAIEEVLK